MLPDKFAMHQGTLSHIPTDEFLIKSAASGFKKFSLWLPSLEAFLNSGRHLEELKEIVDKLSLKIVEITPLHNWVFMTGSDREAKVLEIKKVCAIAQLFNAEFICAPTLGKNGDFALIVENLAILADIAALHKIKVAVEFIPQQQIDSLMAVWQLIQAVNKDNVGILEVSLSDLDSVPIEKIFLVHLSNLLDANETDVLQLARNYRTFPDAGKFNLISLLKKLQQKSYAGYYSLEVFNKDFSNFDAEIILRQALSSINFFANI